MKSPLPRYSIHGEHGRTMVVDWLHVETIAERSGLQDWEVAPHRHELLFQLFWIERGRCALSLDGATRELRGPCLLLVPPPAVHGFRFEPRVQGTVVTVLGQHLGKLLAEEPALARRLLAGPRIVATLDRTQAAALRPALRALEAEFRDGAADWRALAVDAALLRLLVALGRLLPAGESGAARSDGARGRQHARRYRALVEQRFREQPSVAALAAEIGISATQLNRVCQAALGCPAVAVLHARLLLEAQRELAYTLMSIKQIAHGLGFADAAYFTRFFQQRTGLAPTRWRAECGKGLAA